MSRFEIRFIGGKYEGGRLFLPDAGEVGIGRAQELDICLVEDMVSRHHAKLEIQAGQVILTDLGSTNGTFVNGERVQKCEVENDDRMLFGTSILRLVDTALGPNTAAPEPAQSQQATVVVATDAMSGELSDVSLDDLLQLLGGNSRTGVLTVHNGDMVATVSLNKGRVYGISANNLPHMAPIKVLSRMLRWQQGQFGFSDGGAHADGAQASDLGRADEALMEAARQNDEAQRLLKTLGGEQQEAHISQPLGGRLSSLDEGGLTALQLIWDQRGGLQQLLDVYPAEDSIFLESLAALVRQGFVRLSDAATINT